MSKSSIRVPHYLGMYWPVSAISSGATHGIIRRAACRGTSRMLNLYIDRRIFSRINAWAESVVALVNLFCQLAGKYFHESELNRRKCEAGRIASRVVTSLYGDYIAVG